MRILNNDETKLCAEQFEKLISKDIWISDLFSVLDSVLYEYVNYVISDNQSCTTDTQAENLFYLKKIRDVFVNNNNNEKS